MGLFSALEHAATGAAKGGADGAKDLGGGTEKAPTDAWNGAVDTAKTLATTDLDEVKDLARGFAKGASDLGSGLAHGDPLGGLGNAAKDVGEGAAPTISDGWHGLSSGASELLGGIDEGARALGGAAQQACTAGVDGAANGIGQVAGRGAADLFRSAATAAEQPLKQATQFSWGVVEGAADGVGNLIGDEFATDSRFRNGAIERGATHIAEHPVDAAEQLGLAAKNPAVGPYQGGVAAARHGDLAEYLGKAVGQIGVQIATMAVAPEAEAGEGVALGADAATEFGEASTETRVAGEVVKATQLTDQAAASAVPREGIGPIARDGQDVAAEVAARGGPRAFETGSRSDRAQAIINRSAQALGRSSSTLVDQVVYDPKADSPFFRVDALTGQRSITLDAATFGKSEAGQLIAATHELVHAEQWEQVLAQCSGHPATTHASMFVPSRDLAYAVGEVLTEHRALQSVDRLPGGLDAQQTAHSARYIAYWENRVRRLGGSVMIGPTEAGMRS